MPHGSRLGPASLALLALLASPACAGERESRDFLRPPPPSPLDELTADGRPAPGAIDLLRSHVRGRRVRLSVEGARFVVRDVRADSLEVAFVADPEADQGREPPARSPLPWRAIDGIETRHSNVLTGAVAGAVFLTLAGLAVGDATLDEPAAAAIVIGLALPPAGAVIGGLMGARFPRWQHEWPPASRRKASER